MKKKYQWASDIHFVFFGTPNLSVIILNELKVAGFLPSLIVTRPDAPRGRGKVMAPPPVAVWTKEHGIPLLQPAKITDDFIYEVKKNNDWDVFIVAAYGKILPQALLNIPSHGTLNVHPSLLPRLRGPSPIRSAILNDERETGVTIMLLDAEMDHGPIIEQEVVKPPAGGPEWPPRARELESTLAHAGGKLLAQTLLPWVRDEIEAQEQNHSQATFCKTIKKEHGLLNLNDNPYQNLLKIRAFEGWPGTYTFFEKNGKKIRVQIIDAHMENLPALPAHAGQAGGKLVIDIVRPEGKRDMPYADFLRSSAVKIELTKLQW